MDIIVFSTDCERRRRIKSLTDKIISDKRLRLMSLHTANPQNSAELTDLFKSGKGYLVIMDISCCKTWKRIIAKISEEFKTVIFCLMSDSDEAAAEAVNLMLGICGYINISRKNAKKVFEKILEKIYGKISTICSGIMLIDGNGELKVIRYSDIYYIETIKQQHRCTVYHKNGSDIIRADISKLIKHLDARFEITRSSTIANLSEVEKISDRMMYFENGCFCGITAKKLSEIKRNMMELAVI